MSISPFARTAMLPIAMAVGAIFYPFFGREEFSVASEWLIFTMLFFTCCSTSLKHLRIEWLHVIVLLIQLVGGIVIYMLFLPVNKILAEGMFISFFAPVAVAAVTIGGLLGANVERMATACMTSNLGVALLAPLLFSVINPSGDVHFLGSVWLILQKVSPMIIFPMAGALLLELLAPRWHRALGRRSDVSFYLWAISLVIILGRTVSFIVTHDTPLWLQLSLGAGALIACVCQFMMGWYIGKRAGDRVAGGQSLGQKNNILAIWMAQTYLNPLSSIAPASYVVWQNLVNSYQMWKKK